MIKWKQSDIFVQNADDFEYNTKRILSLGKI